MKIGDEVYIHGYIDEIRKDVIIIKNESGYFGTVREEIYPSVQPKEKTVRCKDCKYFEYDSVAKVDGVPLIVAHEICNRWGDGCKTKENGYCFLFEPQERSNDEVSD